MGFYQDAIFIMANDLGNAAYAGGQNRSPHRESLDVLIGKMFGRSHPTHELVEDGYVGFKICEAYVKQMPDDFFLLPPSFEKDQPTPPGAVRGLLTDPTCSQSIGLPADCKNK